MNTRTATAALLLAAATHAHAQCVFSFDNYIGYGYPGSWAHCQVLADLNGDGHPDSAALGNFGLMVNLNAGDGSFLGGTSFDVGLPNDGLPGYLDLGDLDGDGDLDAVVSRYSVDDTISMILGTGDGGFGQGSGQVVLMDPTIDSPSALVIADLNGDGRLDIAIASDTTPSVAVLLGNGDGTFVPQPLIGVGNPANHILARDLDGDGLVDLVTSGGPRVTVLWGTGAGQFASAQLIDIGGSLLKGMDSADLNGDQLQDIVVADNGNNTGISVLLQQPGRAFTNAGDYTPPGAVTLADVLIEDFSGDGLPDMVTIDLNARYIHAFRGDGAGGFTEGPSYFAPSVVFWLTAADLDGDDRIDLSSTGYQLPVWMNTSSSFPAPTITQQPEGRVIAPGGGATLSVDAVTGSGLPISYRWRRNGQPIADGGNISGATTPNLTINPAGPADDAAFDVVVSIPSCDGGTVDQISQTAVLAVTGNPCPGDFNADGNVNTLDVIAFLNAWASGC